MVGIAVVQKEIGIELLQEPHCPVRGAENITVVAVDLFHDHGRPDLLRIFQDAGDAVRQDIFKFLVRLSGALTSAQISDQDLRIQFLCKIELPVKTLHGSQPDLLIRMYHAHTFKQISQAGGNGRAADPVAVKACPQFLCVVFGGILDLQFNAVVAKHFRNGSAFFIAAASERKRRGRFQRTVYCAYAEFHSHDGILLL